MGCLGDPLRSRGDTVMIFGAMAACLSLIALLNLAIAGYVFKQQPKSFSHGSFAFLALATTLWTIGIILGNYVAPLSPSPRRFTFAMGSLVALGVLAWATTFPVGSRVRPRILLRVFIPLALLFCGLSLSPWIVVSVVVEREDFKIIYGWLHPFFAAYILGCLLAAFSVLMLKFRENGGLLRLQARHVMLALSIPGLIIATTNVLVPLVFRTSNFGKYGPFFSLVMVGLIGHAILRHRLMDIRVVVKQGAVYLAAFAVAGAVLVFLLVGSNLIFPDEHWFTPLEILLALSIAVMFHPLKTRIQLAFDRYLYREPYDYQRIIRETSRALSNTIELPAILDCVGNVLRDVLKPEWTAVYLLDEYAAQLECAWKSGPEVMLHSLSPGSPLPGRAAAVQALVFRDELAGRDPGGEADMVRLNAEVAAPLLEEGCLFGLIILGPQRSGSPYFTDDADLLQTLAHQSAVAIRNAKTHQRVVQVNEELKKTLATIESGVVAVGTRDRVSVFNKAAEQFTGLSADVLRGRGIDQLPPVLGRLIEATLSDGQSRSQVEIALPDQVGQMVPLMCTTSPLLSPQGALMGAVAVFSDLSRVKELERERRRAERLASMEAIASGMVHEIRNPLVAI